MHHNPRGNSAGIFGGFRRACGAVFAVAALALLGCLDIPDDPQTSQEIESVSLYILQEGSQDSTLLKIRPGDSAVLGAQVYPRQHKKDLSFRWVLRTSVGDSVLGSEAVYTLPAFANELSLPNLLILEDRVGNSQEIPVSVIVNTPPTLSQKTEPADGDTLYGSENTAVLFKWKSSDSDESDFKQLSHTLVIDSVRASVGSVTEIMQSGFAEGKHTFRVVVYDSYGDADSLSEKTFYMLDTLRGQR
jgi:hypothetical protein